MKQFDYDVLIAGAGPVGLILALDLARRDIRVGLIDKNTEPMPGSKGKGIQPRTQEILEQLDLLENFLAEGGRYPMIRIYKGEQVKEEPYAEWITPTPDRPHPNILMLPQSRTEGLLRRRLKDRGVPVHWSHELVGLKQDDSGVTASVANRAGVEKLRARYLVGADGGHSFVRHALAIKFTGETLLRRAIVADATIDGLATDVWHRWPEAPGGQLSLCPLLNTNLFQTVIEVPHFGDVDLSEQAVERLIIGRLNDPEIVVRSVPWRSLLRVNLRLADRYRIDRVFLAGDAAHIHPPTGAQGLNTGMQDAHNLGWKLAAVLQGAPEDVLESYELERRPIAKEMLVLSGQLLNAWRNQKETQRGSLTHQLELNYRNSSYAVDLRPGEPAVRAGDRAPDAIGLHGNASVRLFDLLCHPHFTLLGFEVDGSLLSDLASGTQIPVHAIHGDGFEQANGILDIDQSIQKIYGFEKGDVVLLRPDGYIGAWAHADRAPEIGQLLRAWTGASAMARTAVKPSQPA